MPYIAPQVRAQGGFVNMAEPWPDYDWSAPTDMATLRHRVLVPPSQDRYGHARDEASR